MSLRHLLVSTLVGTVFQMTVETKLADLHVRGADEVLDARRAQGLCCGTGFTSGGHCLLRQVYCNAGLSWNQYNLAT